MICSVLDIRPGYLQSIRNLPSPWTSAPAKRKLMNPLAGMGREGAHKLSTVCPERSSRDLTSHSVPDLAGGLFHQRRDPANSGRSGSPRKFPVSGRSRQHTEVAVAVDARWRHRGGEAINQLQRRQEQRAQPEYKVIEGGEIGRSTSAAITDQQLMPEQTGLRREGTHATRTQELGNGDK